MKKVIRLTESDLTRIVKRVIKESGDDYKNKSMYDPYYDEEEDEDLGEVDPNEPYDSIGGHSVNDIKKAFKNIGVNVDMEQKMEDLFHKAYDVLEENGIPQEESTMYSEEELIEVVSEFDQDLAEEMEYLLNQLG